MKSLICCLAMALVALGQESAPACKNLAYADQNQIDYGPLRLSAIRGVASDAQGVRIPKVCVGVFNESDHKPVAVTQTDDGGYFDLRGVPVGDYRMVAKYDGLSPANVKLRIERSGVGKTLSIQMRPRGLDSGSFVEIK